jgi:predicted Rossmann fold flavoprotein
LNDSVRSSTGVVVIGAGAAGLATAIFARRANSDRSVLVLDGAKRPGAKILVSGGSRCNVTNAVVTEHDFWGGRSTIVRRILRAFTAQDAAEFFRGLGVALHEEPGGKLFPDSNRSREVLDVLLCELDARGAVLQADQRVLDVIKEGDAFRIVTNRGDVIAPTVVLATGGRSLPKTGSDGTGLEIAQRIGHTIVETTPALAPLILDPAKSFHAEVSGVAHEAELTIWIDGAIDTRLRGSLLWTHFGASGPVAMNASRHWLRAQLDRHRVTITVSFCPDRSFEDLDNGLIGAAIAKPTSTVQTFVSSQMPGSIASALLHRVEVSPATPLAHLTRDHRRRLTRAIVEWPLSVTGTRGYSFAEATAGGVALDEIDPATMASRVCAELFLVGEMLDVDGRIGGFNFQWAWSTAFVAGRALARGPRPPRVP